MELVAFYGTTSRYLAGRSEKLRVVVYKSGETYYTQLRTMGLMKGDNGHVIEEYKFQGNETEGGFKQADRKAEELAREDIYNMIATKNLFFKRTDGGAEYLCEKNVEGSNVGDIRTAVIRLDGGAELLEK